MLVMLSAPHRLAPPFASGGGGVPTSDEVDDGRPSETGSAFAAHNVSMPSTRRCADVEC